MHLAAVEHGRVLAEELRQFLIRRLLDDKAVPAQHRGQLAAQLRFGDEVVLEDLFQTALPGGLFLDDGNLVVDVLGIDADLLVDKVLVDQGIFDEMLKDVLADQIIALVFLCERRRDRQPSR